MKKKKINVGLFIMFCCCITLFNCSPRIAAYDQYAYTQATSLKVEMQNLIVKSSSTKYTDAKDDIDKVNVEIQKAYEYAKGRSRNGLSANQYAILLDTSGFYKRFLNDWNSQTMQKPTTVSEDTTKIGQLMDKIIELENGKNK